MPPLFVMNDPTGNALALMAWALLIVTVSAWAIVLLSGRETGRDEAPRRPTRLRRRRL